MKNILTKTGSLLTMFFVIVVSFIYMNIVGIEINETLVFIAGALVKTFLDKDDEEVKLEANDEEIRLKIQEELGTYQN